MPLTGCEALGNYWTSLCLVFLIYKMSDCFSVGTAELFQDTFINGMHTVYDAEDKIQKIFQGRDATVRMSGRNMDCHLTTQKTFPDTGSITVEDVNFDSSQKRNCNDKVQLEYKLAILHGMVCIKYIEGGMLKTARTQ